MVPTPLEDASYRPCVGIMLLDAAGRIFLGERAGPVLASWQMPQGGIDPGETPFAAALRELREETGIDQVQLLAESARWHRYDVPEALRPAHWPDRFRGQAQRWFVLRFLGDDQGIDLAGTDGEFVRWRWATAEATLQAIVPFKRAIYQALIDEFDHLLAHDPHAAPSA